MSDPESEALEAFAQRVVQQLEKNGFPERKVSFPIERMYDSAHDKGVNFNKVLDVLAARGIAHEKTPEKVVFARAEAGVRLPDLGGLAGFDPSSLAGLSKDELLAAASAAMEQLGPERLAAMRAMVEGMTPEQRAEMLEQARRLGLG